MDGRSLAMIVSRDEVSAAPGDSENFTDFSISMEKLSSTLGELKKVKHTETHPIRSAIESLEAEIRRARALMNSPKYQSSPANFVEDIADNLGRSLGLVLFASYDFSFSGKDKIEALRKEMMSIGKLSAGSSETKSEFFVDDFETEGEMEEETEEEIMEEIVEEGWSSWNFAEVVLQLKCGDDEHLMLALARLDELIRDDVVPVERVEDEGVIPILFNRLGSSTPSNRLAVIQVIRRVVALDGCDKDKMAEVGYLSALVKSLTRDVSEQKEAVGLLATLSDVSAVKRRIGRIQGCIVMLVAIFNGRDEVASRDAGKLLTALSSNPQNVLHMAEAGYFKPLVRYLKDGSDMSKILMATAISRMELRDQAKASVGEDGAIEPLVNMFKRGKLEARLSALSALQNLSTIKDNTRRLIASGIIPPLLQLLFSVTSVLMTLREPASAILARIARSESVLVHQDVAHQMLSLLNLSSPVIRCHLLEALNGIATHSNAGKVIGKMKENGSIHLLLPFLSDPNAKIRNGALSLICALSKELSEDITEQLGETHLRTIVDLISSAPTEIEKAAAATILCNIPVSDKKATDMLKKANLLPILVSTASSSPAISTPSALRLFEGISGILIRFTLPSDKKLQVYSAENGVIPVLLKMLSVESLTCRSRAAVSLAQLSQNTPSLRRPTTSRWLCVSPCVDAFCDVHGGYCSVKSTFCLVKAGAVSPLVRILEGAERGADEAVLDALATLLQDEIWESGSACVAKNSGVEAILKVLEYGSANAQERAVWILERVLRAEAHRAKYAESAQVVLIDLAQKGDSRLKPGVAKLLAQLELLQVQSSYF